MAKVLFLLGFVVLLLNGSAEEVWLLDWQFSHDGVKWTDVTVPHDWAIGEPFNDRVDAQRVVVREDGEKEFRLRVGRTGSLPWIGEGRYRRTVTIPEKVTNAELWFDGAMANSEVFADGVRIGGWKNGYAPFVVPLPVDRRSVEVEIRLATVGESSRWYPGAGLYRPVTLRINPTNRIEDIFVYTERIDGDKAYVCAETPTGKRSFVVEHPRLWTPETPYLYTLEPEGVRYGIRTVEWQHGEFRLNGVRRKFKGVCLHHDLGPLGAAFDGAAFRRQVRLLKEIGCDAIRTSHNIPCSDQMKICDEMGLMVVAESFDEWREAKCANGYHLHFSDWWRRDLEALVRFHRNHPSVVMWSIGNEIFDQRTKDGTALSREMVDFLHRLDPTRPVTQGHSWMPDAIKAGGVQVMDIPGLTYRLPFYRAVHDVSKYGTVLGIETASTVSSRGFYSFPDEPGVNAHHMPNQSSSYDLEYCPWSNLPDDDWAIQDDNEWTMGEFVWTGFDYLGEPAPYDGARSRSSYFGIYDIAGLPKDRAYLYRARWRKDAQTLHVLPHWTWPERVGKVTPVYVYTSYPEVELFINGKSQGRRRFDRATRLDRYRLRWRNVVYEPGELRVVAYDLSGRITEEKTVETSSEPHHLELVAEPIVSQDDTLRYVTVRVVDQKGRLCPRAALRVDFEVSGAASFLAAENGDPTDFDTLSVPSRKTFNGCLTVVLRNRAGEGFQLKAKSGDCQGTLCMPETRKMMSVAVFGGSFSVIGPSRIAKAAWCRRALVSYDDWGIGGAGFLAGGPGGTNGIPAQIERCLASGKEYDAFVLWASTNDMWGDDKIAEQNAVIESCVGRIRKARPFMKILFLTSMPIPLIPRLRIEEYAEGQKETCLRLGVPVLSQHRLIAYPKGQETRFFGQDRLHPNELGYEYVKKVQSEFINFELHKTSTK